MIPALPDGFVLRAAEASDLAALSLICLRTGDAGRDATDREDDPDLLGLIYAVPYQVLEPELAFLLEGPDGPCGYLLGARDTRAFNERLAVDWYPALRARIPPPPAERAHWRGSDWARQLIHHPALDTDPALAAYPSHGHIDLLPPARGRGIGRRLMQHLEHMLAQQGSPGLHLGVDPRNDAALNFYRRLGFEILAPNRTASGAVYAVKTLPASASDAGDQDAPDSD